MDSSSPRTPSEHIFDVVVNFWTARAVYAFTVLGLADRMADGPKRVTDLAAATHTDPQALKRLLRALAGAGICRTDAQGRYTTTEAGDMLRTDVPGSMAPYLHMEFSDAHHGAWGRIVDAVRTGRPVFEQVHGKTLWAYCEEDRVMADHLNRSMTGLTGMVADAVLDAYDFSPYRKIVDVGGGEGGWLAAILSASPEARGTVFDLPHVADAARAWIGEAGLGERCDAVGGSFFETVPDGGDLYTMKWVLHDWDDASSVEILRACRRAMTDDARLLIVDTVITETDGFSPGKVLDLNMMVLLGGRERTAAEFRELLSAAGFALARVIPTRSMSDIVEAVPVTAA
ncbi:methyltransferase [Streptomyces sp. NPDC093252]|uniref:methyltransferase n=1 Tax=Streptomyces sp. NPDC093252 TaxID=3154980 RepID=UPI00341B495F